MDDAGRNMFKTYTYNFHSVVAPTTPFSCGTNEYKCKDVLKCISNKKICDNNRDCPGGDDEVSCCKYLHLYSVYTRPVYVRT